MLAVFSRDGEPQATAALTAALHADLHLVCPLAIRFIDLIAVFHIHPLAYLYLQSRERCE